MIPKYKILKLDNGEDIIALVHYDHWDAPNGYIKVEDALKIILSEQSNALMGRTLTTLALTKWLPYTSDIYATILTSKIITVVNASLDFIAYYKKILKEFSNNEENDFEKEEPTEENILELEDEQNEMEALSEVLQEMVNKNKRRLH